MIDQQTITQIKDAARIEDIVSDFVTLKRRGANYVGLCPFHNEKTPSFSVSPSRNYCYCFSCGEGGNPIGFLMKHEAMSYPEALRYIAAKYHIEVHETQLSEQEQEQISERESMLNIGAVAMKHFEQNLWDTEDGRNIGLSYLRERGLEDEVIRSFHLGYSMSKVNDLYNVIKQNGLNLDHLFTIGLCYKTDAGERAIDKFRGRVMYPIHNIAGKIIGFGGRTLSNDPAKYINSPESVIFKKSNELYGLFQAKHSIQKKNLCYLMEGYMDVISMHQSGFSNALASSGTSLTEGQVKKIHRFTDNVTIIYDGDKAGIKASIRAIDMLLDEGVNVHLLLLPDGHDPDSFCKAHDASYVEQFIEQHKMNFIQYKKKVLLDDYVDPNSTDQRIFTLKSIVNSISYIQEKITRSVYVQECAKELNVEVTSIEEYLSQSIAERKQRGITAATAEVHLTPPENPVETSVFVEKLSAEGEDKDLEEEFRADRRDSKISNPHERELLTLLLRFGMVEYPERTCEDMPSQCLVEYVSNDLNAVNINIRSDEYCELYEYILKLLPQFYEDLNSEQSRLDAEREDKIAQGFEKIRANIQDFNSVEMQEEELRRRVELSVNEQIKEFRKNYIVNQLKNPTVDNLTNSLKGIADELLQEKYALSKIHTKQGNIHSIYDNISQLVPLALDHLKDSTITCEIERCKAEMAKLEQKQVQLMSKLQQLYALKKQFSTMVGERVITPRIKR